MRVIQITSTHGEVEAAARLAAGGVKPLGRCSIDGSDPLHFLVSDADAAIRTLRRHGIAAIEITPPLPVTRVGIQWWSAWRNALPLQTYVEFGCLHHDKVKSCGSLIRIRSTGSLHSEPWRILADAGVDVRCESSCNLPTGPELHLLVPDADVATAALQRSGVTASTMDYAGPRIDQGISWWGKWGPALDYARRFERLILLSFASPRVEHVPGVW
jgi:hypothetical protein